MINIAHKYHPNDDVNNTLIILKNTNTFEMFKTRPYIQHEEC